MLTTFADDETPPLLDAVKAANIPYQDYYKFNNCALFANRSNDFVKMFWKMSQKSYEIFFQRFSEATVQSLQLTRQVLDEREQLERETQVLQEQIHACLQKMEYLKTEKKILEEKKVEIAQDKDFTYEIAEEKQRKRYLKDGEKATHCLECNFTCHKRCTCNVNSKSTLFRCSAMTKRRFTPYARCGACPGECSWNKHEKASFVIESYVHHVTITKYDIAKRYHCALDSKEAVESVIKKMEDELDELNKTIMRNIRDAKNSVAQLEEIALKSNPLTDEEFFIKPEEQQKEGFLDRIVALQKVNEMAEKDVKDWEREKSTALAKEEK